MKVPFIVATLAVFSLSVGCSKDTEKTVVKTEGRAFGAQALSGKSYGTLVAVVDIEVKADNDFTQIVGTPTGYNAFFAEDETPGATECFVQHDEKPYDRRIHKGSEFLITSDIRHMARTRDLSRAEMQKMLDEVSGGEREKLPADIKTNEQFKKYVDEISGGAGAYFLDENLYEVDIQSVKTGAKYKLSCRIETEQKFTMDRLMNGLRELSDLEPVRDL